MIVIIAGPLEEVQFLELLVPPVPPLTYPVLRATERLGDEGDALLRGVTVLEAVRRER